MKNNLLTTTALTCAVGFAAAGLATIGFAGQAMANHAHQTKAQQGVGGGYVGVGASLVGHDGCADSCSSIRVSGIDLGGKMFAGYRFHKYGAVEGTYHFFGEAHGTNGEMWESQGISAAVLAILPVTSQGSVFAKAGALWGWMNQDGTSTENDSSGFSPLLGLGAEINISDAFAIRTEVEYVPNVGDGKLESPGSESSQARVDVVTGTASLIWKFGASGAPSRGAMPAAAGPAPLGFYAGAGASLVSQDGLLSSESSRVTGHGGGGKGFVGYRFHKYAAVEAAYHYFGDAEGSDQPETFESQGVSFALLGIMPLTSSGRSSLFAKVGGIYGWLDELGTVSDADTSGLSPIAGVGMQFDVTDDLSLRGEMST